MQLCTTVMNLFRPALAEISFDMHESRLSKTPQNQVSTSDGDKTFVIFGFELSKIVRETRPKSHVTADISIFCLENFFAQSLNGHISFEREFYAL